MLGDDAGSRLPSSIDGVSPGIATAVARGRLLFNRADYWGSHEALEGAWRSSPDELRSLLQGLIQAGAAFHKLVVQDNPVGTERLLQAALVNLDPYPDEALGLALGPLRAELREWLRRAGPVSGSYGPVIGLPRMEWSAAGLHARITVESVALHQIEVGGRRAILLLVEAGGAVGVGECRHPWDTFGVWDSLVSGLVPALLSEPVSTPGELPLLWADFPDARYARAGLEAAVWDAWARRRGESLCVALGHVPRDVPLMGVVPPGDIEGLTSAAGRCKAAGYRHLLLPARPNADRRVLPGLVRHSGIPVTVELGGSYRAADIAALRVLDDLGASLLAQPVPATELATVAALGRWLETPISTGGWTDAEHLATSHDLVDVDAIHVDPGQTGLTECIELLELAGMRDVPAWVRGSAITCMGAAANLAVAAHPAATLPSVVWADTDAAPAPCVEPDAAGSSQPTSEPGSGHVPEPEWLQRVTTRHTVLRA